VKYFVSKRDLIFLFPYFAYTCAPANLVNFVVVAYVIIVIGFNFGDTNQNNIRDEIKSRLNSRNACYYSVQNLLSSRLISKNLKIKIYKTVIVPVVLYGCETWSLTLGEEHRLRVFENRC
jgi:hypothetical protein